MARVRRGAIVDEGDPQMLLIRSLPRMLPVESVEQLAVVIGVDRLLLRHEVDK